MVDNQPTSPGGAPNSPEASEPVITESNLESKFDEIFGETPSTDIPEAIPEEIDESVEVSEEEELSPSDDESPIVEEAEEEGSEEETDQTQWNDVPYEELKENNFRIPVKDSKTGEIRYLNVDQINSEVNKSRRNDETRDEWEAERQDIEAMRAAAQRDEFTIEQQKVEAAGEQMINQMKGKAVQLDQAIKAAAAEGDSHTASLLKVELDNLTQQYNKVKSDVDQAKENINYARSQAYGQAFERLTEIGYGDIATDAQRQQSLLEYAQHRIPPHLYDIVRGSGELIAILEQSRLYETRTAGKPKTKMKGSGKTLQGRAAKSTPRAGSKDNIQSKIDQMFSN